MRYLLLICCSLILSFVLLLHHNYDKEGYGCMMTYMWRRMFFLDTGLEHPRYSLFLYGEGFYAQKFMSFGILNGIPILFVPGNGGSGRQVRSIGSLLQNKTEKIGTSFHFDTFTLDFNEELTAFDFEYVHSQSEFLLIAIDWIWSLYEKRPPGIVLIGHSMGGIIIQAAIMNEKFNKEKVSFILAFATPYSEAPFYFDKNFYNFWENMRKIKPIKKIISISGGLKDEFIEEIWTNSTAVTVHSFTSSIDRVWLDMDHQCILWCNQLIRQTSRVLFDYAFDSEVFLGNFQNFAYLHYESIGFKLKPLNRYNSMKINEENPIILLISEIENTPIEELITFNKCRQIHEITRYLDANHLFTFVNFTNSTLGCEAKIQKNVKFWMMKTEEIIKPKLQLNFQKYAMQFSMQDSPFAIIPLNFVGDNFLIYQIKINRMECKNELSYRIFFMENGRIRRANEIKESQRFTKLLIYPNNEFEQNIDYKLMLIDPNKCNKYSMEFSIDFRLTIIKALRYNRHILPFSIALTFIFYCLPIKKTIFLNTLSIFFVALLFQNTSEQLRLAFILLFDAIFFIMVYLFCILMIRPLLNKFSNGNGQKDSPKYFSQIWNISFFFIAFCTGNSSILALYLALKNIKFLNNLFEYEFKFVSMVGLQFCSLFIQIPSIWAHISNIIKYGEWHTKSDAFFESNLALMFLTIFLDLGDFVKIPHCSNIYYLSNLILLILVIFIFNRNSACIFIMDDLSLLITLFLIHRIFYQMQYKIII